jgi:hypothetical protein
MKEPLIICHLPFSDSSVVRGQLLVVLVYGMQLTTNQIKMTNEKWQMTNDKWFFFTDAEQLCQTGLCLQSPHALDEPH